MAAPFVAAGAALVRAANPSFTKEQVDDALQSTAWDDGSGNGRDDVFGWGLLQADAAALRAARAPDGLDPDSDGDAVPDAQDPCPTAAGPTGVSGCPLPPGPSGPTVVVRVKAKSSGSKLFVDVEPNKGSGYWRFQVQRLDTGR